MLLNNLTIPFFHFQIILYKYTLNYNNYTMNSQIDQTKQLSSSSISTQQSQGSKPTANRLSGCLIKGMFVFQDLDTEVIIYDDFIAFTNLEAMNIKNFTFNMTFEIIQKQNVPIGFRLIDQQSYEFLIYNWKNADNWKKILLTKISCKGFHQYFNMQKKIGKGAFGTVFEAIQFQTNKKFATKVFIKQNLQNHSLKSIENQVKILRKIQHQNIVKFFGVYQTQFAYYLLFEHLEGKTLEQHIFIDTNQRRQILKQILNGLFYLKELNIVHRDIKPDNIFLTKTKEIKILDFGLASYANIPSKYAWCGTAGYIAPQTFKNGTLNKIDFKIDMFGLGSTFFKMIFNKQLYETKNETEILELNKKGYHKSIQNLQSKINCDEFDLLTKMIDVNPQKRITIELALNHWYFTGSKTQFQKLFKQNSKCQKSIFRQLWQKLRPLSNQNI